MKKAWEDICFWVKNLKGLKPPDIKNYLVGRKFKLSKIKDKSIVVFGKIVSIDFSFENLFTVPDPRLIFNVDTLVYKGMKILYLKYEFDSLGYSSGDCCIISQKNNVPESIYEGGFKLEFEC